MRLTQSGARCASSSWSSMPLISGIMRSQRIDVERLAGDETIERFARSSDGDDVVVRPEEQVERPHERGLVVDHEQALRRRRDRTRSGARSLSAESEHAAAAGSMTRKRLPFGGVLVTEISPPNDADDLVADGQAESRPDADRLRREERVEDPLDQARRTCRCPYPRCRHRPVVRRCSRTLEHALRAVRRRPPGSPALR